MTAMNLWKIANAVLSVKEVSLPNGLKSDILVNLECLLDSLLLY